MMRLRYRGQELTHEQRQLSPPIPSRLVAYPATRPGPGKGTAGRRGTMISPCNGQPTGVCGPVSGRGPTVRGRGRADSESLGPRYPDTPADQALSRRRVPVTEAYDPAPWDG